VDPDLQRRTEIEGPPNQLADLGGLRRLQAVERAMVAPPAIIRRIETQPGIAQLPAAQGPMNEKTQGGLFGPLPAYEFGSPDSWNAVSRASIAAFTATA
jgi:hypothetical protein